MGRAFTSRPSFYATPSASMSDYAQLMGRADANNDRNNRAEIDNLNEQQGYARALDNRGFAEEGRRYDLGREDSSRQDAEKRRMFDAKLAAFAQLFGAGAPAAQPAQGPANALVRMRGEFGDMPEDDGINRRAVNNSLASYLQRMR